MITDDVSKQHSLIVSYQGSSDTPAVIFENLVVANVAESGVPDRHAPASVAENLAVSNIDGLDIF